jgi:hypothetical protein
MMNLNPVLIRSWHSERIHQVVGSAGARRNMALKPGRAALSIPGFLDPKTPCAGMLLSPLAFAKCHGVPQVILVNKISFQRGQEKALQVVHNTHCNMSTLSRQVIHQDLKLQEALLSPDLSHTFPLDQGRFLCNNRSLSRLSPRASMNQHTQFDQNRMLS